MTALYSCAIIAVIYGLHQFLAKFKIYQWVDYRLPYLEFLEKHLTKYPTPKNLNYLWNFGSLAGITLVVMILSGIFLAMQYEPTVAGAFESVERIMRDVNGGWLVRYVHMNGASMFFIVVYIHMFRGMYFGSYKNPRELLWIIGVLIFIIMMATAFMGYVLPWGQMSYWGAQVITGLFTAIPVVGESIQQFLLGGETVGDATLKRFFVLHYLLPFVLIAISFLHLSSLHRFGSNNPLGIDLEKKDKISFNPYYTWKDLFGLSVFFLIFAFFVFFAPNFFGEPDNYIKANPLVTPPHIVPEWYFLPFYAILRSIPDKLMGVIAMFGSIVILMALPWIDRHPVRSSRFRPYHKYLFWVFFANTIVLGWVGGKSPEGIYLIIGRLSTLYYFFHFIVLLPLLSKIEPVEELPKDIEDYEKRFKNKKRRSTDV
jgi:quinol-cytochrome oxidoreductase complex cytochrome b subunit